MRPIRISILLILILSLLYLRQSYAVPQSSISGRVIDAYTGNPIQNASVIIWDLNTLEKPKIGEGIYITDSLGYFNAESPYIVTGHSYWIYAYRGNVSTVSFDYVPSQRIELRNIEPGRKNVSIALVPGAPIVLYGKVWSVESPSPAYRIILYVVAPLSESAPYINGAAYVTTYGGSIDTFFLDFPSNLTVVPSGVKIELKAEAFFVGERGIIKQIFRIDNDRKSFLLEQGAPATLVQLADYSLRQSSDVVSSYISKITSKTDEAQRIGFYVWEERISLSAARRDLNNAMLQLSKGNHIASWIILREAYAKARGVQETLNFMRLFAAGNAIYMPAIFSLFAVVLGFFVFENNRKKFYASILFYIILLVILYQIYPGTKILLSENRLLFIATGLVSIVASLAIAFGAPKFWKERDIEGQVSLRSVTSIIFSMAKRQIWRHRSRSLFAIISIIILILAFTSLTSFGTVYGLKSDKLEVSSNFDAVMIRRLQPDSTEWTEIPQSDLDILSKLFNIGSICPKVENLPIEEPIAMIVTKTGKRKDLYGLLGFDPELEPRYTQIQQIVTQGNFLRLDHEDGILLSRSTASMLGVKLNEEIRFVVRGRPIRNMTVIGFFDDQLLGSKIDLDGQPIAPSRVIVLNEIPATKRCNGTDVIIMPLQTALKLQAMANLLGAAPQFATISRISFVPNDWHDFESAISTLTFAQEYTVYVSRYGSVTKYSLGFRYEAKGAAEIIVPIGMVVLNVAAVMLNAIYERRREMQVLTLVGLNPRHIGLVFVAEAIVVGLVGGGIGYILGLGFYQVMSFFGQGLMVRPKLEWWWSAIGLALALLASVLSALRPAMMAVTTYTPSMTRKVKISQMEREKRKREIFKVFQAVDITMPTKLLEQEVAFFISFVIDRLREFQTGIHEMTKNIEESPSIETPEGDRIHSIKFEFYQVVPGTTIGTMNEIRCIKKKGEDRYRVVLNTRPVKEGVPEEFSDRTIMMVRDTIIDWIKNKEKLMGSIR